MLTDILKEQIMYMTNRKGVEKMNLKHIGIWTLGGVVLGFGLYLSGCSSDSGTSGSYTYQGAGSFYSAALGPANGSGQGDITVEVRATDPDAATADLVITGTYQRYDSGYTAVTVTGCTANSGAAGSCPSNGDEAYGLEVPGMVFLLKPAGADSNIIPMVARGACPTTDFSANWVMTEPENDTDAGASEAYGTASFDTSTYIGSIQNKRRLSDHTAGAFTDGDTGPAATCSNGIVQLSDAAMWLTESGGAIVHIDDGVGNESTIIAMPQNTIALTDLAGDWTGPVFDSAGNSGAGNNFPIKITINASGTSGTAAEVTNVTTGATSADIATLTFSNPNTPANGFVQGVVNNGLTGNMICMVTKDADGAGTNTMFCTGVSPDDNTKLFSVLLKQI